MAVGQLPQRIFHGAKGSIMEHSSSFDNAYSFEEFCHHYDELQRGEYFGRDRTTDDTSIESSFEQSLIVVMEYMREQFSNRREAFFKGSRYVMMMSFLSHNLQEFDRGDYAVYGSERVGALTSEHLLKAVHYFYTSPTLFTENAEPSPNEVMAMANSYRDAESE